MGHIIPSTAHRSLLLIDNICGAGCTSVFKENYVTVKHNGNIFIQVPINRRNGLWKIPLSAQLRASPTQPQIEQSNNTHQISPLQYRIQYLNYSAFSPVTYTYIEETYNVLFQLCPGLTSKIVSKYLPKSVFKVQDHLN